MALAGGMRRHREEEQGHPNESPKLPRPPTPTLYSCVPWGDCQRQRLFGEHKPQVQHV